LVYGCAGTKSQGRSLIINSTSAALAFLFGKISRLRL
jgi:hypothetical protein